MSKNAAKFDDIFVMPRAKIFVIINTFSLLIAPFVVFKSLLIKHLPPPLQFSRQTPEFQVFIQYFSFNRFLFQNKNLFLLVSCSDIEYNRNFEQAFFVSE